MARSFMECYVAGYFSQQPFKLFHFTSINLWNPLPFSGNVEQAEAESMIQLIEDVFFKGPQSISKPLFASQHLTNRVVNLERGVNYVYAAEGLNPSDENSALVHYIQVNLKLMECACNWQQVSLFFSLVFFLEKIGKNVILNEFLGGPILAQN